MSGTLKAFGYVTRRLDRHTGTWRPDGVPETPGNAYNATMMREDRD
jgi:hypothetical protein